jgi:protein-S-isoprenylcysteine O-methyltransferase Ste14
MADMAIEAILRELVYDYGMWPAVVANVALFGLFSLAFLRPRRRIEWRSIGVWSGFVVALFTEMYGFPLTIYLLTSVLGDRYPVLLPFEHNSGHLWVTLLNLNPAALLPIHLVSNTLMFGGLLLMGIGWWQVHRARGGLVTTGLNRVVRHPQYTALFAIMFGALIQWPTLPTLLMAPTLVVAYLRLALREEAEMQALFGPLYETYRARTPAFVPLSMRKPHGGQQPNLPGALSPPMPPPTRQ